MAMVKELKLPELGENIETADVVAVLVKVGDTVQKDQSLIEVETEKASAEVPAESPGVVKEIHVKAGDKLRVGQPIVTLEGDAGEAAPAAAETKAKEAKAKEPAGETVEAEETVEGAENAEVDGAGRTEEAEVKGDGKKTRAKPVTHRTAPVESRAVGSRTSSAVPATHEPKRAGAETHEAAAAAPSVRELARELGVDIDQVPGSGPGGRVSTEDVKEHVRRLLSEPGGGVFERSVAAELPDFAKWGEIRREPMSSVRRKTAEHLIQAWSVIPHVTQFDQADVTEVEKLRKRLGEKAEAAGGKLTVTAIVIKVAASALKVFPKFNTSLDLEHEEIIYKQYVHIGVAVDTDRGLLVPVIRNVDRKNLIEIAVELTDLADRARNRKVTLDELRGSTFSVTNLGGLGTSYFSPIVNWPEVAVLGIGRARTEAVFASDGGPPEPRLILPLSLSYDHRVIDGADAARFLRWMAEAIEQPMLMVLEG